MNVAPNSPFNTHSVNRRTLLRSTALLGGASWLNHVAAQLGRAEETAPSGKPPKSLIVLWLQGGPSQLETFDPHFNEAYEEEKLGGQVRSIRTNVAGIEIGAGLPLVAEQMDKIALVRSVVSKEGDHERGTYHVKSGHRMIPNLQHPSLGAILCHQVKDNIEIPRHISILPGQWPARGGYLGDQYDAFQTYDPLGPIPDVRLRVSDERFRNRLADLDVIENEFVRRRRQQLDAGKTLHRTSIEAARKMMDSEHLAAFDVKNASTTLRNAFGDNPVGRACLAAVQLIEVGVRCVEVTMNGWDTHANNLEFTNTNLAQIDPAYATLLQQLEERKLLEHTLVMCAGEFGRTPRINGLGGRDHWPHGFTIALAGANIRGGVAVGETAARPKLDPKKQLDDVAHPQTVEDVHATIVHALGLDPFKEVQAADDRPIPLSPGKKLVQEILKTA
jgi:uncharacterized protein (DUF1501 family)